MLSYQSTIAAPGGVPAADHSAYVRSTLAVLPGTAKIGTTRIIVAMRGLCWVKLLIIPLFAIGRHKYVSLAVGT